MLPDRFAALVNLAGFVAALSLYAMLLVMVVRSPHAAMVSPITPPRSRTPLRRQGWRHEPLLVATALLGLAWNVVALGLYGLEEFGVRTPPGLACLAFTSLGFLPAVVVHAALRPALAEKHDRAAAFVVGTGYLLSAIAGGLHAAAAVQRAPLPSPLALWLLVVGFAALIVPIAFQAQRQVRARRALSLAALSVFAVSALHLAGHEALRDSWAVELVGHHASLPLALAILYQDYPFALADLFLKRALVVVLAVALLLGAYAGALAWFVPADPDPVTAIGFVGLGIWMAVAYPWLRRGAHWFVDAVMLRRADYVELRASIGRAVAAAETPEEVLRESCARVGPAVAARLWSCWRLDADGPALIEGCCTTGLATSSGSVAEAHAAWQASNHAETTHADATKTGAVAIVPTAEPPRYAFALGDLAGGRRLLSDDLAMLDAVVQSAARRVDQIRLHQERADQRVREAEIRQLATEAELRARRAPINPHVRFNALTTIGYLIQTTPERALEKLVQLTELLRRVLRSEGDFTTVGKELELVRLYLDLERARFEERLRVEIGVPHRVHAIPMPALILQPLVENAIKHGIAPSAAGGLVEIRAALDGPAEGTAAGTLTLSVRDTGRGARRDRPGSGIGLRNVQDRLRHHFGDAASLRFESGGRGTVVTLRIPVRTFASGALAAGGQAR
ncbi:MAG TPA: histidine kinase [Vicinamibacterales bacterium]|nr:histidine kinase [Vicinamibacterales bacterium]